MTHLLIFQCIYLFAAKTRDLQLSAKQSEQVFIQKLINVCQTDVTEGEHAKGQVLMGVYAYFDPVWIRENPK